MSFYFTDQIQQSFNKIFHQCNKDIAWEVRLSLTPLWNLTRKVKRFQVSAMCMLFWHASILALSSRGLKQAFLRMTQRRIVIYIRLYAKAVPSLFYKLCVPLVPLHQLLKKSCLWRRIKHSSASMREPKRVVLTVPTPLPMYTNGGLPHLTIGSKGG